MSRTPASRGRTSRASAGNTFSYSARHRWAYVPTLLFLVVIVAILLIDPAVVWPNIDPGTRRTALVLAGGLALGFAAALVLRWASPFRFTVAEDAFVTTPLIGSARRVPYGDIRDLRILPKTFSRSVPEVELTVLDGRPISIRTDLPGYPQFERALRKRLAPAVQAKWKEERST